MTLGRPRLHLRATTSTNDRARALAEAGAPHGTLVTAGEQTRGRGRQGRTWVGPPGRALLLSLLVREYDDLLPLRGGPGRRRRGRRRGAGQVAQRRAARRAQARGHPGRGPAGAGVGDPRRSASTSRSIRTSSRPTCAIWPARWGGRRARSSRRSASCSARSRRGWPSRRPSPSTRCAPATPCSGSPSAGRPGPASAPGSTTLARCWSGSPTGACDTLSAGEVHLGPS